ncbi:PAS domain S-box protein [Fulvimonas yonginensis]|uniref:histidine kinase n=1 Tax=Fulvimonas yonginensis TaxID=1495200 RepID=A0ABU8JDJ9_9GAMM
MSLPSPAGNEDLFRTLFETAPDAMVVVDREGNIVLANPQAHRLFGYPPAGMLGLRIESLLPESVRAAHIAHRSRYMAQPRVRPMGAGYELTGVRRNGEAFPVEIALSPIGTGMFAASIRDISETQRARQALQRARYDTYLAQLGKLVLESGREEAALRAVLALLAEALGAEGVAIAFGDADGSALPVRAASGIAAALAQALTDALGRDRQAGQLAGRERAARTLAHEAAADDLPALRATLAAHGFGDAAIVPLLDRQEPGVLLALAREPGAYDSDKLHFLQLAANMLAAAIQRSRSEEQLSHAQRLDALGQLTGGIAHDFNNLLTIVSGNLQILDAEYGDRTADAHELIESASRAVDRCINLTRKLLGFARRRSLTPRPVRPQQAFSELADMLMRTLGARIRVSLDCPSDVPAVQADAGELETALVNLALNARDAMAEGGLLSISARERRIDAGADGQLAPGRYVAFVVEDNGSGMSREVLNRALEPFFTTKDAGKGSGLGLSMVYGFVKQSGGYLAIESQPGQGTRVELLLPVAHGVHESPAVARDTTVASGHVLVLVVEDEPGVRKVAVRFLRSLGYDTLEAADAAQALRQLRDEPRIQLLFSDVVLGSGQTGFELVRQARALRPRLPALLASGYERSAIGADEAARSGVELLRKPYRLEQLGEALARALERGD